MTNSKKSNVINLFHSIGEMRISDSRAQYNAKGKNYNVVVKIDGEKLSKENIPSNRALAFAMRTADIAQIGVNKFISKSLEALIIIEKTEEDDGGYIDISVTEVIKADCIAV